MRLCSWLRVLLLGLLSHPLGAGIVTIYVDGIDFRQSTWGNRPLLSSPVWPLKLPAGPSPDRATSYLMNSALGRALGTEVSDRQLAVPWNGDLADTVNVRKAIAELQLEILAAARRGEQINLVTHSMGTLIGYEALKNLAALTDANKSVYRGVEHFVTLATPMSNDADLVAIDLLADRSAQANGRPVSLPQSALRLQTPAALRIRKKWVNVFAVGDEIGAGPLRSPYITNVSLTLGPRLLRHSGPYDDAKSVSTLVAMMRNPLAGVARPQPNAVIWVYTATVTAVNGLKFNPELFPEPPAIGSRFTVTQAFDATSVDQDPRPLYGSYYCANQSVTLQYGANPPVVLRREDFPCPNRTNNGISIHDSVRASIDQWHASMENRTATLRIALTGGVESAFHSDSLPSAPPDLSGFLRDRTVTFSTRGSSIVGRIESVAVQ